MTGTWSGGGRQIALVIDLKVVGEIVEIKISFPSEDYYLMKPYRYKIDWEKGKIEFLIYGIYFKLECINSGNILIGFAYFLGSNKTMYKEAVLLEKTCGEPISFTRKIDRIKLLRELKDYAYETQTIEYKYSLCDDFDQLKSIFSLSKTYPNDYLQLLAILECVSSKFHHDGRTVLPQNRRADNLIQFALERNRSYPCLNCRGLAVVLTEACLAYGFLARSITCVQMEEHFLDCHVVTLAYSKFLGKWIYLDPSYNLIIKNREEEPLNIEEIRRSVIEGKNIYPNKEARYRNKPLDFNVFMDKYIKKLVRFYSPISIYAGYDTVSDNNEIELLPKCMFDGRKGTTSNPNAFW